jgi:hypothetical protein
MKFRGAILVLILLLAASYLYGLADKEMLEHSALNLQQMESLNSRISAWVSLQAEKAQISDNAFLLRVSREQDLLNEMVRETNRILREFNAPRIGFVKTSEFNVATIGGYSRPVVLGFSFRDENNTFCFPCDMGWNRFAWGVTPSGQEKILAR